MSLDILNQCYTHDCTILLHVYVSVFDASNENKLMRRWRRVIFTCRAAAVRCWPASSSTAVTCCVSTSTVSRCCCRRYSKPSSSCSSTFSRSSRKFKVIARSSAAGYERPRICMTSALAVVHLDLHRNALRSRVSATTSRSERRSCARRRSTCCCRHSVCRCTSRRCLSTVSTSRRPVPSISSN